MSKRIADPTTHLSEGQAFAKASPSGSKRDNAAAAAQDEMGEFEDAWEDEIESDEEVVDAAEGGEGKDDGEPHICSMGFMYEF